MRFSRVFHRTRILMGLGLLGMVALTVGCDGGGGEGVSNVTPATPPPGQSGADQAKARAGATTPPGMGGAPKKVEAPGK
jgi:hypothetical protein